MKKIVKLLGILFALCVLTGAGLFAAVSFSAQRVWPEENADCIVVLGARVRPDGTLSDSLRYRCERALEAWEKGQSEYLIVCGGRGSDEPIAESEAMRAWLIEHGVPENRVVAETQSVNTVENLRFAKEIMRERGWSTALVCTSDYHLTRAVWIAQMEGVSAFGLSAPSPKPLGVWLFSRLRECASWTFYGVRSLFG